MDFPIDNRLLPGAVLITTLMMVFGGVFPVEPLKAQPVLDGETIDRISKSVVRIESSLGSGSGSIVNGGNLVYTNRHVVEGENEFVISVLQDPTAPAVPTYRAILHSFSTVYDFAILEIVSDLDGREITAENIRIDPTSAGSGSFPELSTADFQEVAHRGDQISILGYPGIGDEELVYTTGIISSVMYETYNGRRMPIWYRTTAGMAPGNSGGVAFNSDGEIIGIPTSVRMESTTGGRLGNLLSIQVINDLVENSDLQSEWSTYNADMNEYWEEGSILDYSREPAYGSRTLETGFLPNPFEVEIRSGGAVNVGYLENGCIGYAASSPDFRLNWNGETDRLRLFFTAFNEGDDTTLLVNSPDGSWHCNDDGDNSGRNPLIDFNQPAEGQYDIWVGSYQQETYIDGQLSITERDITPSSAPNGMSGGNTSNVLDYSLDPTYDTVTLESGFLPDPYSVEVVAGGSINVSDMELGDACYGYAYRAPDVRLQWSGSTDDLRIFFEAGDSDEDAVLIINAPDRSWTCNDDGGTSFNPLVWLNDKPEGQIDIWVASYSQGTYIEGRLLISELSTSGSE